MNCLDKLISTAVYRLEELSEQLYSRPERPTDLADCGYIDGEYNAWIEVLDILKVPHNYKTQH